MRFAWLIAATALLAACATTPVASSAAKPVPKTRIFAPDFTHGEEGRALLVVTRDKGFVMSACPATFFVDGVKVADLYQTEQLRIFVDEGDHLVGVSAAQGICLGGSDQEQIKVTRAKPLLLRISAGNGFGVQITQSAF